MTVERPIVGIRSSRVAAQPCRVITFPGRVGMDALQELQTKWNTLMRHLDERQRRLLRTAVGAASSGLWWHLLGGRGVRVVRTTIHRALEELDAPPLPGGRARQAGGGRKRISEQELVPPGCCLGRTHCPGHPWPSGIAIALDLQEQPPPGVGPGQARLHGQSHDRGRLVTAAWL